MKKTAPFLAVKIFCVKHFYLKSDTNTNLSHHSSSAFTNIYDVSIAVFGYLPRSFHHNIGYSKGCVPHEDEWASNLVVSDLLSETKSSRFKSGC